jgi:arsenite transporter
MPGSMNDKTNSIEQQCCPPEVMESDGCQVSVEQDDKPDNTGEPHLGCFERWLTLWVLLCMVIGTLFGVLIPSLPDALEKATIANIWLPGSILVWLMVYPMTLGVRWSAIREIPKHPQGILLTTSINWGVQPFVMYGLAILFFNVIYGNILDPDKQDQYIAGAVILGGSPCTAMVFVWSSLAHGDPNYTLAQVVVNDLILLVLYVPTTQLLLGVSGIPLPWDTVFLSVALFVVVPFVLGFLTQFCLLGRANGMKRLQKVQNFFKPVSAFSLLLLVLFIFMSQAQMIVDNYVDALLIMVPLVLQTALIFLLTYGLAYFFRLRHEIAGPAAFIGSSNFFELAVAVAITVYGPDSGAVLVTVIGVLVEVPVMLLEVYIVNLSKKLFEERSRHDDNDSEEPSRRDTDSGNQIVVANISTDKMVPSNCDHVSSTEARSPNETTGM